MKTKEFINILKKLNCVAEKSYSDENRLYIWQLDGDGEFKDKQIATIGTDKVAVLYLTDYFHALEEDDRVVLLDLLHDYAKTPLDEREEEKKYYISLPLSTWVHEDNRYVNKDKSMGYLFISNNDDSGTKNAQTKFTKEEAERILKQLKFELVED